MPHKTIGFSATRGYALALLAVSGLESQMPKNAGGHRTLGYDWSHRGRNGKGSRGVFDAKRAERLRQERL